MKPEASMSEEPFIPPIGQSFCIASKADSTQFRAQICLLEDKTFGEYGIITNMAQGNTPNNEDKDFWTGWGVRSFKTPQEAIDALGRLFTLSPFQSDDPCVS